MMAPLIGLNIDINVAKPEEARIARAYYQSVQRAGAIALLLPPCSDKLRISSLLATLDGLVLIGGRDYSPSRYAGNVAAPHNLVHPEREEFDFLMAKEALRKPDLPGLALCGGMQLLNIVRGGTLIEDIPSELPESATLHRAAPGPAFHPVTIDPESQLCEIYGRAKLPSVRSSHHQAIRRLGMGLLACARSQDGLVEAVEMPRRDFVVGVQWHPERDYKANAPLFRAFVTAAEKYSRR